MTLVRIVYIVFLIGSMLIPSKHVLHMFQQNRYEVRRYTKWLDDKLTLASGLIIFGSLMVGFGVSLFNLSEWLNFGVAVILSGVVIACGFLYEMKQDYIKPLVYTARVKRQIAVMAVLDLLVMVPAVLLLNHKWFVMILAVCFWLNWVMIFGVALVTWPIEKIVWNYYISKAKKILRKQPDLIKIGITGSYGKTSSKNILQAILSEQFRSLMTPASFNTPMGITITIREHLKATDEIFVCEMGADKVGDIEFLTKFVEPKIGLVTSIGPQHLQTFKTMENIINEKMKMIENLPEDGVGIINVDNTHIREYEVKNTCKLVSYGIYHDADYKAINIEYSPKGSTFDVVCNGEVYPFSTRLLGEHNIMNILASIAIARELNVEWKQLQRSVRLVDYVEHRLQVKKINGYTFIDNAFNSNPSGAKMSLQVMQMMPNRRFIVTPGLIDLGEKQYEFNKQFGEQMLDHVDEVILVGPSQTKPIYDGLSSSGFDMTHVHVTKTVKEAFGLVYSMASREDVILLENDLPDAFSN